MNPEFKMIIKLKANKIFLLFKDVDYDSIETENKTTASPQINDTQVNLFKLKLYSNQNKTLLN